MELWWDFIPIDHYAVPLLHCLIGIGDDILSKFRAIISDEIESISPEEVEARKALCDIEDKVKRIKDELKVFSNSPTQFSLTKNVR